MGGMHESAAKCPSREGLRERKKAATREAISRAAIDLALERGPDNVRVADIATKADVSPRTYNNYFASIPEAICAMATDRTLQMPEALRRRPADEPLACALAAVVTDTVNGTESSRRTIHMMLCSTELRAELIKASVVRDAELAEVIAERTGTSPENLFPHLLAAMYSSATRVVTQRWLNDEDADFGTMLREALDVLAPVAANTDTDTDTATDTAANKPADTGDRAHQRELKKSA